MAMETKTRCKRAAMGEIAVGEDEDGKLVYEKTDKANAVTEIGALMDAMAYHLLETAASARAIESVANGLASKLDLGTVDVFRAYAKAKAEDEASRGPSGYAYEGERLERAGFKVIEGGKED